MSQENYGGYGEAPMQVRANDARIGRLDVAKDTAPRPSNLVDRINECERRLEQIQAALNKMYEELTAACASIQNQVHDINLFIGKR